MSFFRAGKMRWLYLLALAQLVGGPLVLLQVTVFTKLALHEAPRMGVAKAAIHAWHSEDFHAVLGHSHGVRKDLSKSPDPRDGPAPKLEKGKMPAVPWMTTGVSLVVLARCCPVVDHARVWTPAWPQAPPGPPPRMG